MNITIIIGFAPDLKFIATKTAKRCVSHSLMVSYFLYIFTSPVLKLP